MTAPIVSIRQESISQNGFYAPHFEVRIEGCSLRDPVLRDVIQLTYKDNIKEIDGFEMTVNNWDPETSSFKYVGSETKHSMASNTEENGHHRVSSSEESERHRLFEPCRKTVTVSMGYVGDLRLMLTGNFTTMEPTFSSSSAPTLNVRGLNVLHRLRRQQNSRTWRNKKDSQIVKSMERGLDLNIKVNGTAQDQEEPLSFVAQRNQYDIDFILSRARRRGYVVFIQEPNTNGADTPRILYFGPSQAGMQPNPRAVMYKLEWGKSLLDFRPTLTTANQVRSVTVNGWQRSRGRAISATVSLDDRRLNRNQDLYGLLEVCDPREEIVVDEPVFTPREARERAIAILMDRQKEMVKVSGTTVGLPDLRAGQQVLIDGVGLRFSGTYFVTETTHTINDSGYITTFKGRREQGDGGEKS